MSKHIIYHPQEKNNWLHTYVYKATHITCSEFFKTYIREFNITRLLSYYHLDHNTYGILVFYMYYKYSSSYFFSLITATYIGKNI